MNGHPALLVRTLNHNAHDAGLGQLLEQHFADLQILMQQIAVFFPIREPTRVPSPVDTQT